METETRMILSTPMRYAGLDGTMKTASFLTIQAPPARAYQLVARIKQAFLQAVMEAQRNEAPEPTVVATAPGSAVQDERPTATGVLMMLAATKCDLPALYDAVRSIIVTYNLARLDGEAVLTSTLVDSMTIPDFEAMVGTYLATFPLAT